VRNYNTKYVIRLTPEEREKLECLVNKGTVAAAKRRRAHILLKADATEGSGWTDAEVARALDVGLTTVHRVRKAFVEQGFEASIAPSIVRGHRPRKLDGAAEARLIALACGPAPEGRARWTLRLLADKLVELEVVESIDKEAVRQTLKKTISSRG